MEFQTHHNLIAMGIIRGPMFCTSTGQPIKAGSMEEEFFRRLEKVQEERPDLISPIVVVSEEYRNFQSAW
jgi:hypothetical protein